MDHKVKHLFFSFKKPVLERTRNKGGKISSYHHQMGSRTGTQGREGIGRGKRPSGQDFHRQALSASKSHVISNYRIFVSGDVSGHHNGDHTL